MDDPTTLAGIPATVTPSSTSLRTTLPAATFAFLPISTFPNIVAPAL